MSVILRLQFPHRRYHATPWDQAANNGVVEWPPSPWRIARALLSVAHTRHPEMPADEVMEVLRPLAEPPTYWVPPTRRGHTRHYMPKSTQRTGENFTQLTFDSYVSVSPKAELVVEWPEAELSDHSRKLLSDLVESLPYLGRAESIVEASIVETTPTDDKWTGSVWRPTPHGLDRLMCPEPGVTRAQLEIEPHQMRRARRLLPEGSRWISYEDVTCKAPVPVRRARTEDRVEVMRWRYESRAPFQTTNGILATDRLRMIGMSVTKAAKEREDRSENDVRYPDPVSGRDAELLSGHVSEATAQHQHAHWLWTDSGGSLSDLLLWVPGGLGYEAAVRVARVVSYTGLRPRNEDDYVPAGFVPGDLNLVGWGDTAIMGDLLTTPGGTRGGRVWVSATPHLLVRRGKKNQAMESLALEDLRSELSFRSAEPPAIAAVSVEEARPVQARLYRRQRWNERLSSTVRKGAFHDRVPVWLRVEFEEPVKGPLVLGGLSHFGFGRLAPVD